MVDIDMKRPILVVTVAALLINRSMALFNIVYSELDVLFQF